MMVETVDYYFEIFATITSTGVSGVASCSRGEVPGLVTIPVNFGIVSVFG